MPFTLGWVDHDQEAPRTRREAPCPPRSARSSRRTRVGDGSATRCPIFLFPGTSTIQTRLRYFLIVPWVYRALEEEGVAGAETWRRGRELELDVSEHLWATSEDRVFGRRAGRRLLRLPEFRLLGGPRSLGPAGTSPVVGTGRAAGTGDSLTGLAGSRASTRWRSPRRKRSTSKTASASRFPTACWRTCFLRAGSAECSFAWEHPDYAEFHPDHKAALEHARLFSEVIYGAPLLYNLLLARRAQRDDGIAEYQEKLEAWSADLDHNALDHWSVDDFWSTVRQRRRIHPGTEGFVNRWIDLVRSGALDVARHGSPTDDSAPARLVRKREKALKGERSRFRNRRLLDQWSGASGVYRMGYRWNIVCGYLRELAAGLSRG